MGRVTLDDVAKLAGVSPATVSRVINRYPHVREELRQRVLQAIETLGYNPNMPARALATNRTNNIGFVIPSQLSKFFADPYFPQLIDGIARGCNESGYTLALFVFHTPELEDQLLPQLLGGGVVDGVIAEATESGERVLSEIVKGTLPFVIVGRPLSYPDVSYVDVDNVDGGFQATSHLLRLGRRCVAIISGPAETAVGQDRLEGYRKALEAYGLPFEERLVVFADFTEAGGYLAARELVQRAPDIDGLFVASDLMAVGAIRALHEAGKRVPEDVSVVGFDDLSPARMVTPPLTTVHQPVPLLGVQAVALLREQIEEGIHEPRRVLLPTRLIVRASCGAGV